MAIYKLGDIADIISGTNIKSNVTGKIPIIGSGGQFGWTNKNKYDGPTFGLPRKGTMEVYWYDYPVWNVDTAFIVGDVNKKIIIKKYLFLTLLDKIKWSKLITGSTRPATRITEWRSLSLEIPSVKCQQQIIDIIEPIEKLFIKYSKLVRIDSLENCKKDIKELIDIIEPIEKIIYKTRVLSKIIKNIAKKSYQLTTGEITNMDDIFKLMNSDYENQHIYFATNAIGEFKINRAKYIDLKHAIRPSRAKISPMEGTYIISKLENENKYYYFNEKSKDVFSTGMFYGKAKFNDHLLGFLQTTEWMQQKETLATGTTMRAINNKTFNRIRIKNTKNNSSILSDALYKIDMIENLLQQSKNKLVKLLIK